MSGRTDPFHIRADPKGQFAIVDSRYTPVEQIMATAPKREVAAFIAAALAERLRQQQREIILSIKRTSLRR